MSRQVSTAACALLFPAPPRRLAACPGKKVSQGAEAACPAPRCPNLDPGGPLAVESEAGTGDAGLGCSRTKQARRLGLPGLPQWSGTPLRATYAPDPCKPPGAAFCCAVSGICSLSVTGPLPAAEATLGKGVQTPARDRPSFLDCAPYLAGLEHKPGSHEAPMRRWLPDN